ncbi:MAG: tetratricopeptide repeat protein [Burkholderiales bacterium]|nr:tetratricopeptide repeat protein [Burkholderiales bacterium]
MPIFGIGLHVIVAIFFAIHVIRTHQNMYWLFILFAFPLLGSIVYGLAIYLPELRGSRTAQTAKRVMRQAIDPGRALREARQAFELTPTVDRRMRLAEALMENGQAADALAHYREALAGPYAKDPALLSGLADAQAATGDHAGSLATLETLFEVSPESKRKPGPALRYATDLAALNRPEARQAFQQALTVAADPEPKCRYGDWLAAQGETDAAKALYQEVVADSRHWHSHAKAMNKVWLRHAESALAR